MNNSPAKPTEGAQGSANSKTPRTSRTDSLIAKFKYDDLQGANCCMAILAEHANQLEQELLSAHGRGYGDDAFIQIQAEKITELERQLAQSEERAAELDGALYPLMLMQAENCDGQIGWRSQPEAIAGEVRVKHILLAEAALKDTDLLEKARSEIARKYDHGTSALLSSSKTN